MSITVKTNRSAWKSAVQKAADKAAAAPAEQMLTDSRGKIPRSAGDERTEGGALSDIGRIEKTAEGARDLVWSNVYAGYQWYGMRADGTHVVRHYTTAGTGKMWVEQARTENANKWQKVAQKAFSEGMK